MLVIDESFDGGGDLLRGQIHTHLLDKFIQCLSRHVALLRLVVIGVVKSLFDSLLELVLLLHALILDCLVASGSSGCKFVLQGLVLLLGLLSKLRTDASIDVVELGEQARSLIVVGGVVDLSLETLSLIDMLLVRLISGTIS